MEDKITLKGNGSFYIREGWLTKGLVEIEKNPELFSKKYFIFRIEMLCWFSHGKINKILAYGSRTYRKKSRAVTGKI